MSGVKYFGEGSIMDAKYDAKKDAYILPPLIGLPFDEMRRNGMALPVPPLAALPSSPP
jgi:hypothetical protein